MIKGFIIKKKEKERQNKIKKILKPKKEHYTRKTFLRIFFYSIIITFCILIITTVVLYYSFKSIVTVETNKKSIDLLNHTKAIYSSLNSWIIPSFFQIKSEPALNYLIYSSKLEKINISTGIDRLDEIITSFSLLHSIYIYNYQTKDFISTINGYEGKICSDLSLPYILNSIEKYGVYNYIPRKITYKISDNVFRNDFAKIDTVNVFTVVVGDIPEFHDIIKGALIINISEEKIRNNLLSADSNSEDNLIIINDKGIVLSHPDKNIFGKDISSYPYIKRILNPESNEGTFITKIDKSKYLISYVTHPLSGWRFINITPYDKIYSTLNSFLIKTIIVFIILMLLAIFLALISSLRIYSPINKFFKYSLSIKDNFKGKELTEDYKNISELQYLDRIFKHIVEKADTYENYIDKHEDLYRQEVLKAFLLGDIEPEELGNYKEHFKKELEEGPFILTVLSLDRFDYLSNKHDIREITKLFNIIREMIFHSFSINKVFIPLNKDHACIIFNFKSNLDNHKRELIKLKNTLRSVQTAIQEKLDYTITIGLSDIFYNFSDLNEKYKNTFHAIQFRFRFGHNSIISIEDIKIKTKENYIFPEEKIKILFNDLKLGKLTSVEQILNDILSEASEYDYEDYIYMVHFIIYHTNKIIEKMKKSLKNSYIALKSFVQEIKSSETLDDLKKKLIEIYTMIDEILQKNQSNKTVEIAEKIKEHINQNFKDPTLCTDAISLLVGFSSCYIRYTFKKVFEISISEYINNVRLTYCKRQLDSTKYPIKKIYKSAGFYNYSYFFTLFKKEMGLTPNQYRFQKNNS